MAQVVTEQPAALGAPVTQQPPAPGDTSSAGAAPAQAATGQREVIPGCPPGLEHLAVAHNVMIKQRFELLELLTAFETANHYVICNAQGQQIYLAGEKSDCLLRSCCGARRAFDMVIADNTGAEVLRFYRPYRCCGGGCCGCWPRCCLQRLEVTRAGQLLGVVTQDPRPCSISFSVRTPLGETVLKIKRGCCRCASNCCACCGCCGCGDVKFTIKSAEDGREVGLVSKNWSGLAREVFSDSDNFSVEFPRDLDVGVKATVLGAVFLIDFMFFEDNEKKPEEGGSRYCCCC